ncbi:MAG: hypothetical protein ACR2GY_04220 [Phycisphaerales bacterium]
MSGSKRPKQPQPMTAARMRRDELDVADRMTFEQRARMGLDLFDLAMESMRVGIRLEHPDYSDSEVHEELVERLRTMPERRFVR